MRYINLWFFMYYKVFFIYLIIFSKEQNLVSFAAKTNKEMSDLGITSLSISDSKAVLENDDVGVFRIFFRENDINEVDDNVEYSRTSSAITIKNKQVSKFSFLYFGVKWY
jgi:hypothetical protein